MRRWAIATVGAALVSVAGAGLGACSSATEAAALYSPQVKETLCLPAPNGEVVIDGQDELRRRDNAPVTLKAVTLERATGLIMVDPALLPTSAGEPYNGGRWPPSAAEGSFSPVEWGKRIPRHELIAAGVKSVSVVFGVSLAAGFATGHASGTRIDYRQAGKLQTLVTTTALILVDSPTCKNVRVAVAP